MFPSVQWIFDADFLFSSAVSICANRPAPLVVSRMRLHSRHRVVFYLERGTHTTSSYYDHDTFGDKQFQYHPPRHPEAASLATLSTVADPDSKVNRHTQSTFTRVHHTTTHLGTPTFSPLHTTAALPLSSYAPHSRTQATS